MRRSVIFILLYSSCAIAQIKIDSYQHGIRCSGPSTRKNSESCFWVLGPDKRIPSE